MPLTSAVVTGNGTTEDVAAECAPAAKVMSPFPTYSEVSTKLQAF